MTTVGIDMKHMQMGSDRQTAKLKSLYIILFLPFTSNNLPT